MAFSRQAPSAPASSESEAPTRRRLRAAGSGLELALLDWGGEGPLVLLHHANGFCAGVWEPVARRLRSEMRLVALDARGHGASEKPRAPEHYRWGGFVADLVDVAEQLAAEHPSGRIRAAVGHSFGGTATLGAAARRPDLFERVVLFDPVTPPPPHAPVNPERERHVRLLAATARRRRRRWASRAEAVESWSRRRFFASWAPEALEAYARWGLVETADGGVELACPPEVEAMIFEQSGSLDVFALSSAVRAPTTFYWAQRGDFAREVYERLAAGMERAGVVDVPTGHLIPMERPDLAAQWIREAVRAEGPGPS